MDEINKNKGEALNITLEGTVDDIDIIYQKCSIIINPALVGSGLKIKNIEALSRGVPLITTSIGAGGLSYFSREMSVVDDFSQYPEAIEKTVRDYKLISNSILDKYQKFIDCNKNNKTTFLNKLYTIYIRNWNPFFRGLQKLYNFSVSTNQDFLKTKSRVFLWSALFNKENLEIWNYRKQNLLPVYSLERGAHYPI